MGLPPVTLSLLFSEFLDFERKHAPEAWQVAGVPVWSYLRQRVFDELNRQRGFHAERQSPPVHHYLREAVAQRTQLRTVARRYDVRRLDRAPILVLSHTRHYALGEQHV